MSGTDGPSIIAPTVETYWVHLHCLFAVVTATSTFHALQLATTEAGDQYDPSQEFTMGKIQVDNHPRVQVGIEIAA